jgi:hypothetical protein
MKNPSFTVSPTKQFYHCFGCGAHGSSIGFLMEYSGLSFVDAIRDWRKAMAWLFLKKIACCQRNGRRCRRKVWPCQKS